MKKFVCELCEGSDVRKENGMFVCMSCGCQYSLSEAKNLLKDVPDQEVPVQTVAAEQAAPVAEAPATAANTEDTIAKHLENARRAKEKEDWEETERYYNKVEELDPSNIEAVFCSAYAKARRSLIDSDIYKRQAAFKVLENSISLISDKYDVSKSAENAVTIVMLAKDLCTMIDAEFVYTITKNGYGEVKGDNACETYILFGRLINAYSAMMQKIRMVDDNEIYYKASIMLYSKAKPINNGAGVVIVKYTLESEEKEAFKLYLENKYWQVHKEEYNALMKEKEQIEEEIRTIKSELFAIPSEDKYPETQELNKKCNELKSLGIFAGKRKKELEEEIITLKQAIKAKNQSMYDKTAPIMDQMQKLTRRLREVETALNGGSQDIRRKRQ